MFITPTRLAMFSGHGTQEGAGAAPSGGNDANTVLLLHMNGANNSTTFTDSAIGGAAPHTVTRNTTKIDTSQSVFGGASAKFVAADGDPLTLDGSSDFAFGTGDFTVDFRVRFATLVSYNWLFDTRAGASTAVVLYVDGPSLTLRFYDGTADRITGAVVTTSTWYHVAIARSGTSTKLFIDGTQSGSTYTDTNNYTVGASRPYIGVRGTAGDLGLDGWMDELRVSKGIARWTTTFTPPSVAYS